jgi:hypothetical protein
MNYHHNKKTTVNEVMSVWDDVLAAKYYPGKVQTPLVSGM